MTPANDLKVDLRRTVAALRRLAFQIQHELREAGTQARKHWKEFLEPQLAKSEKLVRELVEASRRKTMLSSGTTPGAGKAGPEKRPARRSPARNNRGP